MSSLRVKALLGGMIVAEQAMQVLATEQTQEPPRMANLFAAFVTSMVGIGSLGLMKLLWDIAEADAKPAPAPKPVDPAIEAAARRAAQLAKKAAKGLGRVRKTSCNRTRKAAGTSGSQRGC